MREQSSVIDHFDRGILLQKNMQQQYLLFLAMLCMTIMICKGIFSYRLVEVHGHVMQAGQLIAPLWFILCDVIAEVYGYKITKKIIIAGFVCQLIFAFACSELLKLPSPAFWHENNAYQIVFGSMWRVSGAVLIAFFMAGFINIRLITWWKFLINGKYFWLRSIGASGISELLFSIVATFMIQYGKQSTDIIIFIIMASAALKLIYSIALSVPANIVVYYLKKLEGIV